MQAKVDALIQNSPKISDAANRMESLRELLDETEQQIEAIVNARAGIVQSEARLTKLAADVDNKIDMLREITRADLKNNPLAAHDGVSQQEQETIRSLKRRGWTIEEIARRTNHSVGEVDLVLAMPDDK